MVINFPVKHRMSHEKLRAGITALRNQNAKCFILNRQTVFNWTVSPNMGVSMYVRMDGSCCVSVSPQLDATVGKTIKAWL